MTDIDRFLEQEKTKIDLALQEYMPRTGPPAVTGAMLYSLEAGGKRLRPILVIATARTLGSEDSSIDRVACALEYIHTYSLIHDDLPAMDDSALRRGKPSCHCVFGEAVAILAGDALLTLAFETAAAYGARAGYEQRGLQIMAELSAAAGVEGMIGGQVLDLEAEGKDPGLAGIEEICRLKTGALLKAAVRCGALAAKADASDLDALTVYASCIGTAFQIVDDLLDYESTTEQLGKPAGSDARRSKATYPALLGPEKAREKAEALHRQALSALDGLSCDPWLLRELARKMVYRKK